MDDSREVIASMRKRPGMYVGSIGANGIYHLVQEAVSNSLDQFLAGNATRIIVECTGDFISVSDDGAGLPPKGPRADFTAWFTEFRDTPSATGHAPHVHLEPVGIGLIVLNGLSSRLEVESCCRGVESYAVFSRGELLEFEVRHTSGAKPGTTIRFVPDPEIFKCSSPDHSFLRHKLFEAVHLVPGLKICLNEEVFYSEVGLIDLARILCGHGSYYPAFATRQSTEDIIVDAVALGPGLHDSDYQKFSWANGSRTEEHGSHVNGLMSAIKIGRKTKWNPASLLINVTMREPKFAGPTKSRLWVPEIEELVQQLVQPAFEAFISNLPSGY